MPKKNCYQLPEAVGSGLQTLIDQWDTNHDGQIDYPEFLAMMRANNEVLFLRRCRSSVMRSGPGCPSKVCNTWVHVDIPWLPHAGVGRCVHIPPSQEFHDDLRLMPPATASNAAVYWHECGVGVASLGAGRSLDCGGCSHMARLCHCLHQVLLKDFVFWQALQYQTLSCWLRHIFHSAECNPAMVCYPCKLLLQSDSAFRARAPQSLRHKGDACRCAAHWQMHVRE